MGSSRLIVIQCFLHLNSGINLSTFEKTQSHILLLGKKIRHYKIAFFLLKNKFFFYIDSFHCIFCTKKTVLANNDSSIF